MSQICQKAADEFRDYAFKYHDGLGSLDREEVIDFAYSLVQKYGEASGELACEFYEMVAEMQGVTVEPAQMASITERNDFGKALNGALKTSEKLAPGVVQRMVKQVGADTMLQNSKRDGAYFAWVPHGNSCAYCLMIAAIGWQKAGKNTIKGRHAEHIHANCDCQFVIDFKGDMKIEGYEPEALQRKIMGIVDPDGMEYGEDTEWGFTNFLRNHGHNSGKKRYQFSQKDLYKINKAFSKKYPLDYGQFSTFANTRDDGKNTDLIRPHNIIKELNKSDVGINALNYINENNISVNLLYNVDNPEGYYGEYDPYYKTIYLYANRTNTIHDTATTIIHEAMHAKLGTTLTKREEVLCFIEEYKHDYGKLTIQQIRDIIKKVNNTDAYKDLPWR